MTTAPIDGRDGTGSAGEGFPPHPKIVRDSPPLASSGGDESSSEPHQYVISLRLWRMFACVMIGRSHSVDRSLRAAPSFFSGNDFSGAGKPGTTPAKEGKGAGDTGSRDGGNGGEEERPGVEGHRTEDSVGRNEGLDRGSARGKRLQGSSGRGLDVMRKEGGRGGGAGEDRRGHGRRRQQHRGAAEGGRGGYTMKGKRASIRRKRRIGGDVVLGGGQGSSSRSREQQRKDLVHSSDSESSGMFLDIS